MICPIGPDLENKSLIVAKLACRQYGSIHPTEHPVLRRVLNVMKKGTRPTSEIQAIAQDIQEPEDRQRLLNIVQQFEEKAVVVQEVTPIIGSGSSWLRIVLKPAGN